MFGNAPPPPSLSQNPRAFPPLLLAMTSKEVCQVNWDPEYVREGPRGVVGRADPLSPLPAQARVG